MQVDELTRGREPYGFVQNNGCFPDWNAANTATPAFYGRPYGNPIPGYVAPKLDVTVNTVSYKHNSGDDTMEIESISNKGKSKIKKLSNGFAVTNRIENYNDIGEIGFAVITYSTKSYSGITIIPGNDYKSGKFDKYFEHIVKLPGCSKAELNALIAFALKVAPCQKQKLFPHQGICEFENGAIEFSCNPGFSREIERFIPSSVLKRKALVSFSNEEAVKTAWTRIFSKHPILCYLSNQYLMALLMYFLNCAGIYVSDFQCIKPSDKPDGLTTEKLTAMLSTNNFHKYPVPTLESGRDTIEKEYSEVYDGVFLINDSSFADEENKMIDGFKAVIRCIRKCEKSNNGRNISMIISKNAGYTAAKIVPENVVIIDTEGVELNFSEDELESITDKMTSLVLYKAMGEPMVTKAYFAQIVPQLRQVLSEYATGDRLDTLTSMFTIESFLSNFLGINRYTQEMVDHYLNIINYKGDRIMSANTSIKKEFAAKLSEKLRSNACSAVKKVRDLRFDDNGKTGVISGNRLLVSSAMIDSVVHDMDSTKSFQSVIDAFNTDGDLICTDGYTHPFDSHNSNGKYQRLYFYDLPADILDEDVLYMLQNPETTAFLLTKAESKIPGFMPLISDKSGKIGGKRFIYNDADNDSSTIYGQSGEGKTFTKAQLMASRFAQGYDILVFDTSDSDTYEALCTNLSKKFVDDNVVFHKLDDGDLNIDILRINRAASLPSQKKEMVGIITAAVGDLSVPQTNALRTVCSELLERTDVDKPISPDVLLRCLNKEGTTYESLRNRLEPLFMDIKEYGLTNGTWKDIFRSDHKIHIVQINEGFSENGNQIIDALLAGLFNYKREHPQRPLSVVIDEVQNQNFSASSPIKKILKEGRKHHLSVVAATQDFYARSTEIGSALGKAGMQIFHRPTQDSANLVAAELRWNKADMARFDSMNRGDVIIKGALYNKELGRNTQAILGGHIYPFPVDEYISPEDAEHQNSD